MVTMAPVVAHCGVHFAALGLPHMLNGGAAVKACSLSQVDELVRNPHTSRCAYCEGSLTSVHHYDRDNKAARVNYMMYDLSVPDLRHKALALG